MDDLNLMNWGLPKSSALGAYRHMGGTGQRATLATVKDRVVKEYQGSL